MISILDLCNQLRRPEGYEDCIATRLIEKDGAAGTVRDAIAIMYTGMYTLFQSFKTFS